jgi:hypothetical protein
MTCQVCRRPLRVERSIKAGMGPVCEHKAEEARQGKLELFPPRYFFLHGEIKEEPTLCRGLS